MSKNRQQIVSELATVLASFNGRDYSEVITEHTLFMGDLGFSSIDVVILGETLESHFGTEISFGDFVNDLRRRNALDVMVGDLAGFLEGVV